MVEITICTILYVTFQQWFDTWGGGGHKVEQLTNLYVSVQKLRWRKCEALETDFMNDRASFISPSELKAINAFSYR